MQNGINIPEKDLQFIQKADYHLPVVLDGNWVNSLGIVRGLGTQGVKSVVINHTKEGAALSSRYTGASLICPTPWDKPKEFIDYMERIGGYLNKKGVLLLTDDTYLKLLSEAKNRLKNYFIFSFPDIDVLSGIMDKKIQYKAAEQLGIKIPKSDFINIHFPALVKGLEGKEFFRTFRKQVVIVHSREEINEILKQLPGGKIILQEQIMGDESNLYSFCCYMNPKGRAICQFTGRKLHQYPREFGTCSIAKSVECNEIIEPSINLLRKLGFFGVAQVEYKRNQKNGQFYLIEVNARFWKWHSLATACNINFADIAYHDLINEPYEKSAGQKYGLKWIVFPEEIFGALSDVKNKRFKLLSWIKKVFPPYIVGLFSLKDPRPWLGMIKHKILLRKKGK